MNISPEDLYFRNSLDVTPEELIGATHTAKLSSGSPSTTVARVSSKPAIRRSQGEKLPGWWRSGKLTPGAVRRLATGLLLSLGWSKPEPVENRRDEPRRRALNHESGSNDICFDAYGQLLITVRAAASFTAREQLLL